MRQFWFKSWQDYWWWITWVASWPLIIVSILWVDGDYLSGVSLGLNVALISYRGWAIGRDIHGHRKARQDDHRGADHEANARTLNVAGAGGMAGIADAGEEAGAGADLIEPIVAFRGWGVGHGGFLTSVSDYATVWPARKPLEARCRVSPGKHPAPQRSCACGVYAVKTEPKMQTSGNPHGGPFAWGRVALWGRVEEAEDGYRAEFAYPVSITLVNANYVALMMPATGSGLYHMASPEALESLRADLALHYGVPVRIGTAEELTEAKRARYEAMGIPAEVKDLVG